MKTSLLFDLKYLINAPTNPINSPWKITEKQNTVKHWMQKKGSIDTDLTLLSCNRIWAAKQKAQPSVIKSPKKTYDAVGFSKI